MFSLREGVFRSRKTKTRKVKKIADSPISTPVPEKRVEPSRKPVGFEDDEPMPDLHWEYALFGFATATACARMTEAQQMLEAGERARNPIKQ